MMALISVDSPVTSEGLLDGSFYHELWFRVSLSSTASKDVTFSYKTSSATSKLPIATEGQDFDFLDSNKTLTIAQGQREGFIKLKVYGDSVGEGDEAVVLTLSNPVGAGFSNGKTTLDATGTITDSSPLFSVAGAKVVEGSQGDTSKLRYTVKLASPANQITTIDYAAAVATKNSVSPEDYVLADPLQVSIPIGQTLAYVDVDIPVDSYIEGSETLDLNFSNPLGARFAKATDTQLSVSGTVTDTSPSAITIADVQYIEGSRNDVDGAGRMRFVVNVSAPVIQDLTLNYVVGAGAAKSPATIGADLTSDSSTGTVTIYKGQSQGYIDIYILDDDIVEGDEGFEVTISPTVSDPLNASSAKWAVAKGTIIDDESLKTLDGNSVSIGAGKLVEGQFSDATKNSQMAFPIKLSSPSNNPVKVYCSTYNLKSGSLATAGKDYVAQNKVLITFEPGCTQKDFLVPIIDDSLKEDTEIFGVQLSLPKGGDFGSAGATITTTGTIYDNEPTITISTPDKLRECEAEMNPFRFYVTLSAASTKPVTVKYRTLSDKETTATANKDYVAVTSQKTITFNPGETQKYIDIKAKDDYIKESSETFKVELSSPVGAGFATGTTLTATATILDDEPLLSVQPNKAYENTTDKMRFEVSLSEACNHAVTVKYATSSAGLTNAATPGATKDYIATTGTLTFAPGETLQYVYVELKDDYIRESDEYFNLILSKPAGAGFASGDKITVVGTILDNEPIISV